MPVTVLSDSQIDALYRVRKMAWTRSFLVVTRPSIPVDPLNPFSAVTGASVEQTLMGDWDWRGQNDLLGSPGGRMRTSMVILNADIAHSGSFVAGLTRMVLDGIECSVDTVTPYPSTRELLVGGTRVRA